MYIGYANANSGVTRIYGGGATTGGIRVNGSGNNDIKMGSSSGTAWHSANDGSGSGLDADTLDGISSGSFLRSDTADTASGDITFSGGAGAVTVAAASDIRIAGGTWTGEYTGGIKIQPDGSNSYFQYHGTLYFRNTGAANRFELNSSGNAIFAGQVTANGGFSGSGANLSSVNAATLDSLDSTQFLRSDAEDTITAPLNINGGTGNGANDATLYVTASNNNDWGLKINNYNSSATEYGARIEVGSSANYALQITGNGNEVFRVTGAGTVTLASTLDGRDIAADGTKLDGIESGATADQTNAEIATALRGQTIGASGNGNGTSDIYNDNWFRNNNSGEGLYNQATTQHWYSDDDDYWNIAGGTGANGIRFRDEHNGTIRGYVYANSSNQIGFLNQAGNWSLRTTTSGITKLGSKGYQLIDGNVNNNLYLYNNQRGIS